MTRLNDRSLLLQLLTETPVVSFACKKIGLNRTTYYRWYNNNKDFRDKVDEILKIGRIHINDLAEASIIKEINQGNMRANIFWLQHNHPAYKPVRTTYVDPINHRHELLPGEMCKSCGYKEPLIKKKETDMKGKLDNESLSKELYKKLQTGNKNELETRKIIDDFIKENNIDNTVIFKDFGDEDELEEYSIQP